MNTAETTAIEKLAANVLETRFESFDAATLENARNRIIDTVGCLIGGSGDTGNPELVGMLRESGGKEEATILVHGGKVPADNAAMVNSVMSRSFDFEPVSPLVEGINTPGHVSGTTVPTAITMGEAADISGRELMTALLVGDDIASRMLAASGFGFTLGWDGTGTVNAFGATAIAGRMLGLNKLQMRSDREHLPDNLGRHHDLQAAPGTIGPEWYFFGAAGQSRLDRPGGRLLREIRLLPDVYRGLPETRIPDRIPRREILQRRYL